MIRFTYPKSFVSLLLIGFSIVAAPLVFALFTNVMAFEKLAAISEQAVHSAIRVTQASRSLVTVITSLERSARQYAVAGESTFLEAYRSNRASFLSLTRQLDAMALSDDQRAEVVAIERLEKGIDELVTGLGPVPELTRRLPREFTTLADRGQALVRLGDQAIDQGIEQLRTQAVQSRNSVFWLMIALIPTALALIGTFTYLISRPITQVSEGIRGLGEGQFGKPIAVEGPGDMVRLGAQLDWLRERLVTLEAQKTRFLQHISHELKTPLTALREGSDQLSSGVVGNLNAEQREIARILQENSIELRKLIEGLLNYSAVHAQASYLDARIVPLRDVVRRVVNDRKLPIVAKDLRIELNLDPVSAYVDEEKVRIVLDNLLSNAINFAPY
jgi:two-component system sensor histidine kinase GlrK